MEDIKVRRVFWSYEWSAGVHCFIMPSHKRNVTNKIADGVYKYSNWLHD